MEDLAQQFYDGDLPNPLDLTTEIQNKYEEQENDSKCQH